MLIVLRKTSIKRTLALSLLLIIVGYAIANPLSARASSKQLAYIYPYATNNPVETTGLFWLESNPELGAYPLAAWTTALSNKLVVVGIPEDRGYMMGSSLLGDKLGKYIVYRLRQKLSTPAPEKGTIKEPPPLKDKFIYKRTIGDVTEEIKVDIGEHFKDNDSFEKFMDTVRKNLTDNEMIKDTNKKPAKQPKVIKMPELPESQHDTSESAKAIGNTLMLGGSALMLLKLLLPLIAL